MPFTIVWYGPASSEPAGRLTCCDVDAAVHTLQQRLDDLLPPPAPAAAATTTPPDKRHHPPHAPTRIAIGGIDGSSISVGDNTPLPFGAAAWPLLWLAVLTRRHTSLVPLDLSLDQVPDTRLATLLHSARPAAIIAGNRQEADRAARCAADPHHHHHHHPTPAILTAADLLTPAPPPGCCAGDGCGGGVAAALRQRCEEGGGEMHVFFTSGSTGFPKGVVAGPGAALRAAEALGAGGPHGVCPGSRVLLASAHTFDPSAADIIVAALAGAELHVSPPSLLAASLGAYLSASRATHLLTAPAVISPTVAALRGGGEGEGRTSAIGRAFPHLRSAALGGEVIPRGVFEAFCCAAGGCGGGGEGEGDEEVGGEGGLHRCPTLLNLYGVTEGVGYQMCAAVAGCSHRLKMLGRSLPPHGPTTLGAPLGRGAAVVLAVDLSLTELRARRGGSAAAAAAAAAPAGGAIRTAVAELCLAGEQVAAGYLGESEEVEGGGGGGPSLTAFPPSHPPLPGRFYPTGDLVEVDVVAACGTAADTAAPQPPPFPSGGGRAAEQASWVLSGLQQWGAAGGGAPAAAEGDGAVGGEGAVLLCVGPAWGGAEGGGGGGGALHALHPGGYAVRYLGRRDQQVKLNGRRVDLHEVESAALRSAGPAIAEMAVVLAGGAPGGGGGAPPRLVAFCVVSQGWAGPLLAFFAEPGAAAPEADAEAEAEWGEGHDPHRSPVLQGFAAALRACVRGGVKGCLPQHMVPHDYALIIPQQGGGGQVLPTTASGKVDRRALAGSAAAARLLRCPQHGGVFLGGGHGDAAAFFAGSADDSGSAAGGRSPGFLQHVPEEEGDGGCSGACGGGGSEAAAVAPDAARLTAVTTAHQAWLHLAAAAVSEVLGLGWEAGPLLGTAAGLRHAGVQDFRDLSGDSLAAVRVAKRLHGRLGSSAAAEGGVFGELLPDYLLPRELLRRPKLSDYARHLETASTAAASEAALRAAPAELLTTADAVGGGGAPTHHLRVSPDALHAAATLGHAQLLEAVLLPPACCDGWGCAAAPAAAAPTPTRAGNAFLAAAHRRSVGALAVLLRHSLLGGCPAGGALHVDAAAVSDALRRAVQDGAAPVPLVAFLLDAHAALAATAGNPTRRQHLADTLRDTGAPPRCPAAAARAAVLRRQGPSGEPLLHACARGGGSGSVLLHLLQRLAPPAAGGKQRGGGGGGGGGGAAAKRLSPDLLDTYQRTPLHWAAVNGHADLVARLVEADADGVDGLWPPGAMLGAADAAGEAAVAMAERRAVCAAAGARPDGVRQSVFAGIAKTLGGSGSTQSLKKAGRM